MPPTQLAHLLGYIKNPGRFYAAGAAEIYAPSIQVEGVGPIALPLMPYQAKQLVAVAERAPYGKGEETLVDTDIRRTWQIAADKIHIGGKYWAQNLAEMVAWVTAKLGVAGAVRAELYKLLVYDTGSFFLSHRDTEKAPGMFATLVIVLPSAYQGGELLVRHRGQEARLDLRGDGPSEFGFAAFYADCSHEVLPVTSGCRLTLVYNLLRNGHDTVPEPPDYAEEQAHLADWLRQWGESANDEDAPLKLVYPLEHAYSQAELSFAALKGADAGRGMVAGAAAEQADCEVYLALVSIEESGYAEYAYHLSRRWHEDDEDEEFEVGEVTERELLLTDWRRPDGSQPPWAYLPFEERELCPPDAFEGLEPDELDFQEATGNAGASFDRAYRKAGLVFWPRRRRSTVLSHADTPVALAYLADMAERWEADGQAANSPTWAEAHEVAWRMLCGWPRAPANPFASGPSDAGQMLAVLSRLRALVCIEMFASEIAAAGVYSLADNEDLSQALGLLPPRRAAELVEAIVAGNAARVPTACADLLACCVAAPWAAECPSVLAPAAAVLVAALPGDPQKPAPVDSWRAHVNVEPHLVEDLLAALERIDPALAEQAADCLLMRRGVYDVDTVLLPALLRLGGQTGAATARLRDACLAHLQMRIAEALEPPSDWTRPSAVTCNCKHCAELSRFLADSQRADWTLRAVQAERSHVEQIIRQNACDVDFRTEKRGSPHALVCEKNQASYLRRVEQRKQDILHAATLQDRHGL